MTPGNLPLSCVVTLALWWRRDSRVNVCDDVPPHPDVGANGRARDQSPSCSQRAALRAATPRPRWSARCFSDALPRSASPPCTPRSALKRRAAIWRRYSLTSRTSRAAAARETLAPRAIQALRILAPAPAASCLNRSGTVRLHPAPSHRPARFLCSSIGSQPHTQTHLACH
eukprot:COSAG06_NODE_141_length_22310_cov_9.973166_12_plen_171_part_00